MAALSAPAHRKNLMSQLIRTSHALSSLETAARKALATARAPYDAAITELESRLADRKLHRDQAQAELTQATQTYSHLQSAVQAAGTKAGQTLKGSLAEAALARDQAENALKDADAAVKEAEIVLKAAQAPFQDAIDVHDLVKKTQDAVTADERTVADAISSAESKGWSEGRQALRDEQWEEAGHGDMTK